VLNRALVLPLALYLAAPLVIAAAVAAVGTRRPVTAAPRNDVDRNPLQFATALQMALLFQVVLMAVYLAQRWGRSGVLSSAAVLGLTDVDALTMSMARAPGLTIEVAVLAIAIGIASNTALKLAIALFFGSSRFQMIVGATLAAMLVSAVVIIVL
jgi:uncharacterized membrane protein (DUF4010 family)